MTHGWGARSRLVAALVAAVGMSLTAAPAGAVSGPGQVEQSSRCLDSLTLIRASQSEADTPSYLVALPQSVTADVGPDDVTAQQGGRPLDIQVLAQIDPRKLDVAIVVDTTASLAFERRLGLLVATGVVSTLPRGARVGVIDAAAPGRLVMHRARDHEAVAAAIRALGDEGGSGRRRLLDAIGTAGALLGDWPGRNRAMVVVSGGPDRVSEFRRSDVRRELRRSRTSLTVVDVGSTRSFPDATRRHPRCVVGDDVGGAWGAGRALGRRFGGWLHLEAADADPSDPLAVTITGVGDRALRAVEVRPFPPLPKPNVRAQDSGGNRRGAAVGVLALPGVLALLFLSVGYLVLTSGKPAPRLAGAAEPEPQRGPRATRRLPPLVRGSGVGGAVQQHIQLPQRVGRRIDLRVPDSSPIALVRESTDARAGGLLGQGRGVDAGSGGAGSLLVERAEVRGSVLDRVASRGDVRQVSPAAGERMPGGTARPPGHGSPGHGARSVRDVVTTVAALKDQAAAFDAELGPSRRARVVWWSGVSVASLAVALRVGGAGQQLSSGAAAPTIGFVLVLIGLLWLRRATIPPYTVLVRHETDALELDEQITSAEQHALRVAAADGEQVGPALRRAADLRTEKLRRLRATWHSPLRSAVVPVLLLLLPGVVLLLAL